MLHSSLSLLYAQLGLIADSSQITGDERSPSDTHLLLRQQDIFRCRKCPDLRRDLLHHIKGAQTIDPRQNTAERPINFIAGF